MHMKVLFTKRPDQVLGPLTVPEDPRIFEDAEILSENVHIWVRLTEYDAPKYVGHKVRYQSRGTRKEHHILRVAASGKSIKIDNDGDLGTYLNVGSSGRKIYVCISK